MAIYVGAGTFTKNLAAIPRPAGVINGDVLLCLIGNIPGIDLDEVLPPVGSGWELLEVAEGSGPAFSVFGLVAGGAEPATYPFIGSTAAGGGALIVAYRYVDLPPEDIASGTNTSSLTNLVFPSVTATDDNKLVLCGFGIATAVSNVTPPTSTTERVDISAGGAAEFIVVYDTVVDAGATGSRTAALGASTQALALSIALLDINQVPYAPGLSYPIDGTPIDLAAVNRFTWTFSDPQPTDSQTKFDLRYRIVGAGSWTDVTATTTNQYWDATAALFTAGDYEWQVRTYDTSNAVGPWTASEFYTAAAVPTAPTITAPEDDELLEDSTETITWTASGHTHYQVRRVADSGGSPDTGSIYFDSGALAGAGTSLDVMFPVTGREEHVQVRIKKDGLWSPWASVHVQVAFAAPAAPSVALAADNDSASLQVLISNPAPEGAQPAVVRHEVWIDDGDGLTRRAANIPPGDPWTYWTPISGRDYSGHVQVVTYGDNGAAVAVVVEVSLVEVGDYVAGRAGLWTGDGPPGTIVWSRPGDEYMDRLTGDIYELDAE